MNASSYAARLTMQRIWFMKVELIGPAAEAPSVPHIYIHDCKACVFLGHAVIDGQPYDFYYCTRKKGTVIDASTDLLARYGNEPDMYQYMMVGYCSALSTTASLGLALLVRHLGANGANGFIRGTFFKDNEKVLEIT